MKVVVDFHAFPVACTLSVEPEDESRARQHWDEIQRAITVPSFIAAVPQRGCRPNPAHIIDARWIAAKVGSIVGCDVGWIEKKDGCERGPDAAPDQVAFW